MWKTIRNFTLILLGNLFAFLGVWYILDLIFNTGPKFMIGSLVLSVVSLGFLWSIFLKKSLREIEEMAPKQEDTTLTQEQHGG